jgi:hypothetical protein
VILAAGGFDHDMEWRRQHLPVLEKDWSFGNPASMGDGIRAGEKVGGSTDLLDEAWWFPAMCWPDGRLQFMLNERMMPSQFVVNGDGTYTVRFNKSGTWEYVTVDSQLPSGYADYSQELWVALAEKAYAQMNEMGWMSGSITGDINGPGPNTYVALNSGLISDTMRNITGQTAFAVFTTDPNGFTKLVADFNAGNMIGLPSLTNPPSSNVVGTHAYALISYDTATQSVTLYNPWGSLIVLTWHDVQLNFPWFEGV